MCTKSGHALNKCYRLCKAPTPGGDGRGEGMAGSGEGDSRPSLPRSLGNQQRLAQVSISIPLHALPLASQSFNYRVQSKDGIPKTKPVIISSVLSQNYS